jgi:hypothetical protein
MCCITLQRTFGTIVAFSRDSTPLNDHGRSGTATVTHTRYSDLAFLQLMSKGNDDSTSTGTDRMTERDRTTLNVDLCRVNVHDLFGSTYDNGEGFVELEQSDVVLRDTGCFQGLGNGERWCSREVDRSGGGISVG